MKLTTLLLALTVAPLSQAQQWLDAGPGDLITPETLANKSTGPIVNNESTPVSFERSLDRSQSISTPAPYRSISRQYWLETTGATLKAGLSIPTSAEGALVRISAAKSNTKASASLKTEQLWLGANDAVLANGVGIKALADSDALQAAAPFPQNTVAFKLAESVGFGALKVGTFQPVDDNARFVVHVFEPNSNKTADLMLSQNGYFSGEGFEARLGFKGMQAKESDLSGFAVAPSGQMVDLKFSAKGDQWLAKAVANDEAGMWEIHIFAHALTKEGQSVIRNIKSPLAIAAPTAKLNGQVDGDVQSLSVGIDVGVSGRFAVRGVLYGTNQNGQLVPASASESAQWLHTGANAIQLSFGQQALHGLSAPFELRHLQLLDQSRMGVLHQQQRAVRLTAQQDFR